jgi:CheY-like chemotaxis protein
MATILIIDDDDDVREMLVAAIEDAGHTAIDAPGGQVGLQRFTDERPDLVLTDIIMPGGDGIEIIRKIRSIDAAARIVAISGGGERVNAFYCVETARKLGAMAVLLKPFEVPELIETIDRCLHRRQVAVPADAGGAAGAFPLTCGSVRDR